jgi:hypothetical protein
MWACLRILRSTAYVVVIPLLEHGALIIENMKFIYISAQTAGSQTEVINVIR